MCGAADVKHACAVPSIHAEGKHASHMCRDTLHNGGISDLEKNC